MTVRIKTNREEFEAAEDNGYVYGEIRRQKTLFAYVELGKEEEYIASPTDDPKTEYRLFRLSNIFIAVSNEQLDKGQFIFQSLDTTAIIYC